MAESSGARRRQRRRGAATSGEPAPAPSAGARRADTPDHVEAAPEEAGRSAAKRGSRPRRAERGSGSEDRALSGLVGAGPSQVGVDRALRARDVNRPTADDLAEAERGVEIVRRHWKPERNR